MATVDYETCAGGHPALSQVWCPWWDAQGRLLSLPSVDLLSWLSRQLAPQWPQAADFATASSRPLYLLAVLALQVVVHCVLWRLLERIGCLLKPGWFARQNDAKRMYVVANLMKSVVLGLQVASPSWWYYSYLHYRCVLNGVLGWLGYPQLGPCDFEAVDGQVLWTQLVSVAYTATDIAALLVVPKLPATTIIHHLGTSLFVIFVIFTPFHEYQAGQKLMMYGFFSTLAYAVNTFLALRVVYPGASAMRVLAAGSALIYALSCFINWSLHLLWLGETLAAVTPDLPTTLYLASGFSLLAATFRAYLFPSSKMSPRVETLRNIAVLFAVAFITVCMVQSGGDAEAVYAAVGRMPINFSTFIYLMMVATLVRDDLILMGWLLSFDPAENLAKTEEAVAKALKLKASKQLAKEAKTAHDSKQAKKQN